MSFMLYILAFHLNYFTNKYGIDKKKMLGWELVTRQSSILAEHGGVYGGKIFPTSRNLVNTTVEER